MQIVKAKELTQEQKKRIIQIWNAEYAVALKHPEIPSFDQYLSKLGEITHYLAYHENELMGWLATFIRDEEKWFALLIDTTLQRNGVGTLLLNNAKDDEPELNGWVVDHNNDIKENGKPYLSPLNFYLKNGFGILKDIRLENEKMSAVKIKWNRA